MIPILAALENSKIKSAGTNKWSAQCPAHDDRTASLCIGIGEDGRMLLKCQAGCATPDIVAALGMSMADLFPPKPAPTPAKRIAKTYDYQGYQVVRYEPKDFRQRRPDGHGGWIWNLDGVKRVLYRLPELANVSAESIIWISEGEKDVDNLWDAGSIATCNAGGAGKWKTLADDAILNGHLIGIIADKDKAGRAHAQDVASRLHGRAASVRVIEVPNPACKDAADFISAGGEVEELIQLWESAPEWTPGDVADVVEEANEIISPDDPRPISIVSVDKLVADSPILRPVIIDGLLRRGEVANIIAAPKTGKSWAVHNLAMALAMGGRWLGYQCTQGRTLLIDNELHKATLSFRLGKVAQAHGCMIAQFSESVDVLPLRGNLRDLAELGATLAEIPRGKYDVVIIDSLYRAIPRDIDENSNADITRLYNMLDKYAAMMNAAFVVIHHTSKGVQGGKSATDVGAGAGAQARAADAHIIMRPHEESGVVVVEAVVRSFPPPLASCWRLDVPTFYPAADLDPTALKRDRAPRPKKDESGVPKVKAEPWTPQRFAERFIGKDAKSMDRLKAEASGVGDGLTDRKADTLTRQAVAMSFAYEWPGKTGPGGHPKRYATIPCPVVEAVA